MEVDAMQKPEEPRPGRKYGGRSAGEEPDFVPCKQSLTLSESLMRDLAEAMARAKVSNLSWFVRRLLRLGLEAFYAKEGKVKEEEPSGPLNVSFSPTHRAILAELGRRLGMSPEQMVVAITVSGIPNWVEKALEDERKATELAAQLTTPGMAPKAGGGEGRDEET
jgi:hypothetical protein